MWKITRVIFSDGHTGWKISDRSTNGIKGFEIHYSDDGECITDHVYTIEDALLIAKAPKMLDILRELMYSYEENGQLLYFDINKVREVLINI
jgi:hypothetical protein